MNFIETMNVYHTVKYLLHNYIGMLMNLVMDTDVFQLIRSLIVSPCMYFSKLVSQSSMSMK